MPLNHQKSGCVILIMYDIFFQRLDKKCLLSFISLIVRRDNQSRSNLKSSSSSYSGLVHPISLVPFLIPALPCAASGGDGGGGGGGGSGVGRSGAKSFIFHILRNPIERNPLRVKSHTFICLHGGRLMMIAMRILSSC